MKNVNSLAEYRRLVTKDESHISHYLTLVHHSEILEHWLICSKQLCYQRYSIGANSGIICHLETFYLQKLTKLTQIKQIRYVWIVFRCTPHMCRNSCLKAVIPRPTVSSQPKILTKNIFLTRLLSYFHDLSTNKLGFIPDIMSIL